MRVQIKDLDGPLLTLIRQACEQVAAVLAYEGVVHIDCDRDGLNPESRVSATDTGIHFNGPGLLSWRPQENELTFCIYEEVAHFIIGKRGLPHAADVLSDFLQEMFAAYVERTLADRHYPGVMENANLVGIPSDPDMPGLHRDLAKMVGYELAGDARATSELDSWLAGPGAGHDQAGLVIAIRDGFPDVTSAEHLAALVLEAYQRASKLQGP